MPPKRKFATGQTPAEKKQSGGVQKNRKLAPTQRITRSRATLSPNTPADRPIPLEPRHGLSTASLNLIDSPPTKGQKRAYLAEDERPAKRIRGNPQPESKFGQSLSRANLEKHNSLEASQPSDKMDPSTSERGARKRPLSQQSSAADMSQETKSVQSQTSYTAARYRLFALKNVKIFIRPGPPPKEIRPRIDAVLQRTVSEERKHEMSGIANSLCNEFISVLEGASREDDCVEPIHTALSAMDSGKKFGFPRKADWDQSLKPNLPHEAYFDFTFLAKPNDKVDGSVTEARRQQQQQEQGDAAYASPEPSQSAMPPPPLLTTPKPAVPVKTPRPDITAGLRHSTIVDALVALGLGKIKASAMLETLQEQQLLCSDPVLQALPIRFPHMVVEGKSYSTGKPVFEAQNQAAISGSCMTNLQHMLTDLTERASPGSYRSKAPLAFSICTEGPHMELWVHYTTWTEGVRIYNMNILKTCHASLEQGVLDFLVMVDLVMSWASNVFLNEIAEQLRLVARAERVQHA